MGLRKFIRLFKLTIERDGYIIGIYSIIERVVIQARSIFYRLALNAPGMHVGGALKIRGTRCIDIGEKFRIEGPCWIEAVVEYLHVKHSPQIRIGDRVAFSEYVHVTCIERVQIDDGVLLGSKVHITDHSHGRYDTPQLAELNIAPAARPLFSKGAVVIGKNVWIGDNVVVIGPAVIGEGAIIGANAVVTSDIPAMCIAVGAPAKVVKSLI